MKNITISENEYLQLVQTIKDLKSELQILKARFLNYEKKTQPSPKSTPSPIQRLQGVITLPDDFDHKDFLGDELLASYLSK